MATPALWQKKLSHVLLKNAGWPQSRYLQLATRDVDGTPSCRTMVFREFSQDYTGIIVHTDMRSAKITQLRGLNIAEICWYFSHSRDQFRLKGEVALIDSMTTSLVTLRLRHWQALSDEVRGSYATEVDPKSPSINFGLIQLTPHTVEHLQLHIEPHVRTEYIKQPKNDWLSHRVQP